MSSPERARLHCSLLDAPAYTLASISEADRAAGTYVTERTEDGDINSRLIVTTFSLAPGKSVADVKAAYARGALELRKQLALKETAGWFRTFLALLLADNTEHGEAKRAAQELLVRELRPLIARRTFSYPDDEDSDATIAA